jgi:AbiV family abortive infection protein
MEMKLLKEDLFSAIEKSLVNAHELHSDAKILKENNRFARAYTCFQFCIEEVGKAALTYQYLLDDDTSKSKLFLKDFRDHKTKTNSAIGIDMLMLKIIQNPVLKKKTLINSHIQNNSLDKFNNLKNYSLYTSLIDGKFYLPSEIVTETNVEDIEFYAKIRLEVAAQFYKIGIKEFDEVLKAHKEMDEEKLIGEMVEEIKKILSS